MISPDKKPCRCCVRRRSPPKNLAHVLERAGLGAGCAEGTGGQDHPKRGPQWELVCHETPVLCLAFLPAPIPAGAGPGGDGGGTGEKLSHCQFLSSSSPREPHGSKGRKAVPPSPLGSRQLTLSKRIPSVGGANFLITSQV